jgi:hypothetical protein
MMIVASKYLVNKDKILSNKANADKMLEDFYRLNYDTFEGRNTNPTIILEREKKFEEFFESLLT